MTTNIHPVKTSENDAANVTLAPRLSPALEAWMNDAESVHRVASYHRGPLHVIFPQGMSRNITDLKKTMGELNLEHRIYFAHKPTKSAAFIRQALKDGIGLDVASDRELISALSAGFTGSQIECTGVKTDLFLELALRHQCMIVIDSIEELKRICKLKDTYNIAGRTPILIRVSDVSFADRQQKTRHSRFGTPQKELASVWALLRRDDLNFMGYHLHNDEREADIRAGQVENLLNLIEQAYSNGFEPTIINIGGGLRRMVLADYDQWAHFVNTLEEALMNHRPSITWEGYAYGMRLNDKGKVMGRGSMQGLVPAGDFTSILKEMFLNDRMRGRPLNAIIAENGFEVVTEPGNALLDQCGVSLFRVVEVKQSRDGENMILVDGNMYNLAVPMREYLMDPILIPAQGPAANDDPFSSFIIGNLCREEDFLSKRRIGFSQKPRAGDLIAFANTAAYKMDFENATPHLHTAGTKVVAYRKNGQWHHCAEDAYNPFDAGEMDL